MKNTIKGIILSCVVGAVIGSIIGSVIGIVNRVEDTMRPIDYCIREIKNQEYKFLAFTYFYEELEPKSELQQEADPGCDLYSYYITTFACERKIEWYCFVKFNSKSIFDRYTPEELLFIDCDIMFETQYT